MQKENRTLETSDISFENVTDFIYLGTKVSNQNDIHNEVKSRLNPDNAYYH
jgi:hypothetical protein